MRKMKLFPAAVATAAVLLCAGAGTASAGTGGEVISKDYGTSSACAVAALSWAVQHPGDSRTAWCVGSVLYIG
ncbi:hypothetical protein [Streptomyces sp. NPDC017673]|uniref:hypothetical protein n=1 Tax=unclassified Streptomyces TaxID=2593676 RepID=UPI0037A8B46A